MSLVSPSPPLSLAPSHTSRSHLACAATAFALVAALYLPWFPNFLRHRQQVSHLFHTKPFRWDEVAKVCYQMFAIGWDDAPPSVLIARGAAVACLVAAMAMFAWGRGGLRLLALAVLATFDGAILASVSDRNIIGSRYFVFAQALFLCGLPPLLVGRSSAQTNPKRERGARADAPRWRFASAFGGVALAALVTVSAWLCLAHSDRRDAQSRRPGMIAAMAYLADASRADEPVVVGNPILQVAAAGHAMADEPVLVMGDSASFPYFQGTAVMREEEYISRDVVANLPAQRLWVIDAYDWAAPAWTVRLPDPWVDIREETFPEWMAGKCRIVVRCCVKRGRKPTRNRSPVVYLVEGTSHVQ